MLNHTSPIISKPFTKTGRENWERIFGEEDIEEAIHDARKSHKKAKCQSQSSQS